MSSCTCAQFYVLMYMRTILCAHVHVYNSMCSCTCVRFYVLNSMYVHRFVNILVKTFTKGRLVTKHQFLKQYHTPIVYTQLAMDLPERGSRGSEKTSMTIHAENMYRGGPWYDYIAVQVMERRRKVPPPTPTHHLRSSVRSATHHTH